MYKLRDVGNAKDALHKPFVKGMPRGLLGIFICMTIIAGLNFSSIASLIKSAVAGGTNLAVTPGSGAPGTHIFISGSGFLPGEQVEPFWNYTGPGTGIAEKSFYLFNPIVSADSSGNAATGFFVPTTFSGIYPIAAVGLKSGNVDIGTFKVTASLDTGIYQGAPGSVLRFSGWGFAPVEAVDLYWDWTPENQGTFISHATTDHKGSFSNRDFTVPAGTANGKYTLAAIGSISGEVAQQTFTIPGGKLETAPSADEWSSFGYNDQGTRYNPKDLTIDATNVSSLAVKWKATTSPLYKIEGSPVIAKGIVYIGTVQGYVYAYNVSTGGLLWSFSARAPIYGTPTIENGIAYFGSVNYPGEDTIGNYAYALNARTGDVIWENPLTLGGDWVPPLVSNGRVFYPSAYKEGLSGGFSAFDALTGAPLWSMATPYGIWAPDITDKPGDNLYVGTGNPCFTEPTPTPGDGCSGTMFDLNPATGAVIWSYKFPDISGDDDIASSPVYNNGRLYVGIKNGIYYSLDAFTGKVLWQYNTGSSGDNGIYSSAAYLEGTVYFGSGDHKVHALDARTGSLEWAYTTHSLVTSSPSIANGVLYIGSLDGNVYALSIFNGQKLWSYSIGAPVWSSPVVAKGVMYVAGGNGYLYAFSLNGE